MAEQIITKELIFQNEQDEKLTIIQANKSPKLNLYYQIDLRLYSLFTKVQILKLRSIFTKILKSDSFSKLGFQTLPNYLSNYNEGLVH